LQGTSIHDGSITAYNFGVSSIYIAQIYIGGLTIYKSSLATACTFVGIQMYPELRQPHQQQPHRGQPQRHRELERHHPFWRPDAVLHGQGQYLRLVHGLAAGDLSR
jgi:hypothetical protein